MASVKSWWSWTSDTLEDAVAAVLKQGACPKHVAFIMDGNRRFARGKGLPVPEGHKLGYLKLQETLQWCLRLGVEVVTVYAFSIENFSRTQDEVDALMSLAEEKFDQIIREDEIVQKYGVSIRVLGDISRLPTSLQASIARAVQFSAHNDKSILNVCFSYISTEELERSKREIEAGITKGQLLSTDVTSELISQCMYTEDCPEPDIIIRTSGETRLSDFMLWQGGTSHLTFSKVLWPDLSLLDFAWLMMKYQLDYPLLEKSRTSIKEQEKLLQRQADLQYLCSNGLTVDELDRFQQERSVRIEKFLRYRRDKWNKKIEQLRKLAIVRM